MKSFRWNDGAAYSRPVLALAGTAGRVALGYRRGVLVRRWVSLRRFVLLLCASLCFAMASRGSVDPAPSAHPQTPAAQGSPQRAGSSQTSRSEPETAEQTRSGQYTLSHERQAQAVAYSRAGYTLYFVSYFLHGLFLFLILRLGWAAKFRDNAENVSDKKWIQGLVFVPLLFLTIGVLNLPLHLYGHALSLHYEQSIQGWGSWFWDWSKGEFLTTVFGIVLGLILFTVMRRSPRRWWLYFWFPAVLILLGLIVITPVLIDPLFNKFEPLSKEHPGLVAAIEKLTKHAGVPILPERMFLMEASRKTKAINAYVTGLGGSKRFVIWDTTIQKSSNDECLFIVGHELGHHVLGELDLSDPNPPPLVTFWLYSHPPLADRLVFAHNYDPWSGGESPKYVK